MNKPLIRPYFSGGTLGRGTLTSHYWSFFFGMVTLPIARSQLKNHAPHYRLAQKIQGLLKWTWMKMKNLKIIMQSTGMNESQKYVLDLLRISSCSVGFQGLAVSSTLIGSDCIYSSATSLLAFYHLCLQFWLKARPLHDWTTLTLQTRYSRQVSMTIIHTFASDIGSPQFTSCSRNLLCLKSVWCFLSSPTSPSWPCCQ